MLMLVISILILLNLIIVTFQTMVTHSWIFWIIARNIYFAFRWPVSSMYLGQSPDPDYQPRMSWIKASLVDMVSVQTAYSAMCQIEHVLTYYSQIFLSQHFR